MPRSSALQIAPDAPMPGVNLDEFYQTPNLMSVRAIRAKFTAADWCLWAYVQMVDPHGDRMYDLPTPDEIGKAIGLSERQVKRSLVRLEEEGLYKYEVVKLRGQNLAGQLAKQLCKNKREKKFSEETKMTNLSKADKFVRIKPRNDRRTRVYSPYRHYRLLQIRSDYTHSRPR